MKQEKKIKIKNKLIHRSILLKTQKTEKTQNSRKASIELTYQN